MWGVPLFFLLFGVLILVSPYISARTALKTNAAFQSPISGSADVDHFVYHSEIAHVDMPGAEMHRAAVRPEFVLLYPAAGQAFVVARHFFTSDESWAEFCRIVVANVRQVPQRWSFLRITLIWLAIIVAVFIVWELMNRQ